jgi:DNA-binding NarL/FixJ family response regulator
MTNENQLTDSRDDRIDQDHSTSADSDQQPDHVITVLLADDQDLIRAGFAMVINSQPDMHVVGQASDGAQAVELVKKTRPDVVLMDVRMPGENGISATGRIAAWDAQVRASSPAAHRTRVIILTTFDLDEYVMSAIREGASGFLLKDTTPEEMLASIRTVYAGNAIIAPSATRRLISRLAVNHTDSNSLVQQGSALREHEHEHEYEYDQSSAHTTSLPAQPAASPELADNASSSQHIIDRADHSLDRSTDHSTDPRLTSLTTREREVLIQVAHGLSNQEIAHKLVISLPTVKTHVAHILAKTGSRDRVQAVVFAYENGLVR